MATARKKKTEEVSTEIKNENREVNAAEPKQEPTKQRASAEAIRVEEIQLTIYGIRVVPVDPQARRVLVENVGTGDLYVGADINELSPLVPGESAELVDEAVVYLMASSRPTARVSMYAK